MRRLFLAVSALTLLSLAACGRRTESTDSRAVDAAPPRQPADTTAPPRRPVTEASAVSGGDAGAYGMPRAPVPYNELDAYERRGGQDGRDVQPPPGQPGQPPGPPRTQTTKPRTADTVFY